MSSSSIPLFPPGASSVSTEMDLLYAFILAVSAFFTVLVVAVMVYFTIKYRRRTPNGVGADIHGSLILELTWTFIPFVLSMIMFGWGASLFYRLARPPQNSMEITVVGKQWMWKIQHPEGVREINELHVPIGQNVRITLGSEDVIHDFAIPAFRVRMDAVPGKLTTMWFNATMEGEFHIYCDQYCGTRHSAMIGVVYAMKPEAYAQWIAGSRGTMTPVDEGAELFTQLQCSTCHKADNTGRGPSLVGIFGKNLTLTDGRRFVVDDNYLRESIVNSQAKVVQGYQPIMPAFQGQVTEEQLLHLMAYIKSLGAPTPTSAEKSER
jgi:cytochrome c oxidase subunit 2